MNRRFKSTFLTSRLNAFEQLASFKTVLEPIKHPRSNLALTNVNSTPIERIETITGYNTESFWHTSAHILGLALETHFGDSILLSDGPPTQSGFFYDALIFDSTGYLSNRLEEIESDPTKLWTRERINKDIQQLLHGNYGKIEFVSSQALSALETICTKTAKRNHKPTFLRISKQEALHMFALSPFKLQTIVSISDNVDITVYKVGDFVDLCKGPHIFTTNVIKSFWIQRTNGVQHTPDLPASLSRVSGISFPTLTDTTTYKSIIKDQQTNNHRTIGSTQSLFYFHPFSPGAPIFLPHGTKIIHKLKQVIRGMYRKMGFEEISTPLVFDKKLWEMSGHWAQYKENMFDVTGTALDSDSSHDIEEQERGLKPMHCPAHCLVYSSQTRSIRNLPLRLAEFTALHRYFILT
jgi:threonyl-tRNA synthetase